MRPERLQRLAEDDENEAHDTYISPSSRIEHAEFSGHEDAAGDAVAASTVLSGL